MKYIMSLFVYFVLFSSTIYASEQTPTQEEVAKLYVATFNRAPDSAGLDYWVNDSRLTLSGIARSFFVQSETQTLYPAGTTVSAFIQSVYQNLFNRAPDSLGLSYWEDDFNLRGRTRDSFILAMINGAQDNADGMDKTILNNKNEVGLAFANANLYDPNDSLAKSIMSGVSSNHSSVTNALEVYGISSSGDSDNMIALTRSLSDELGCSYDANEEVYILYKMLPISTAVLLKRAVNKTVPKDEEGALEFKKLKNVNPNQVGDCGGTMSVSSDVYTFDNYCTSNYSDAAATINGVGRFIPDEAQSTYSFSTLSPFNIQTTNPSTKEKADLTISLTDGFYSTTGISASSISITDNIEHSTYSFNNLSYVAQDNGSTRLELNYTDTTIGTVSVVGTFDADHQGSIQATTPDGAHIVYTSMGIGSVYSVTVDGNPSGTLDCSAPVNIVNF